MLSVALLGNGPGAARLGTSHTVQEIRNPTEGKVLQTVEVTPRVPAAPAMEPATGSHPAEASTVPHGVSALAKPTPEIPSTLGWKDGTMEVRMADGEQWMVNNGRWITHRIIMDNHG